MVGRANGDGLRVYNPQQRPRTKCKKECNMFHGCVSQELRIETMMSDRINIFLDDFCLFLFTFFNVASRELKVIHVTCILFLVDSAGLDTQTEKCTSANTHRVHIYF